MSTYKVNFPAAQNAVQEMEQNTTALINNLTTLEDEVKSSLNVWEGAAKNSYTNAQALWNEAGTSMAANSRTAHQILDQIASAYAQTENRGGSNWEEVASAVPH